MTRDLFFSTMASGAFDAVREPTDFLVAEVLKAEGLVARLLAMDPPLPEQQIHADLHFDNVLAEGDEVRARGHAHNENKLPVANKQLTFVCRAAEHLQLVDCTTPAPPSGVWPAGL